MLSSQNNSSWKPNRVHVITAYKELLDCFKQGTKSRLNNPIFADVSQGITGLEQVDMPDKNFLLSCSKIAAFLMDKEAVSRQLVKLNSILVQKYHDNKNNGKYNMLREVLEEELSKFGFHPHVGKTLENVRAEVFRAAIFHGLLLKDPSFENSLHGEYTHLIQWLCIAWQQQESGFHGQEPTIKIFTQLGEEKSVYFRSPITLHESQNPDFRRAEKSIWDLIVDRSAELDTIKSPDDFREPEVLTNFIIESDNQDLALLKHYVETRLEKREADEDLESFKEKHTIAVSAIENSQHGFLIFKRKNNKIAYKIGKMEDVLEPLDIEINIDEFKNKP